MARLIDQLERQRLEHLVEELGRLLRLHRTITLRTTGVEDIELWRKAARLAGRRLGVSVRTGISRDGTKVWASEGP